MSFCTCFLQCSIPLIFGDLEPPAIYERALIWTSKRIWRGPPLSCRYTQRASSIDSPSTLSDATKVERLRSNQRMLISALIITKKNRLTQESFGRPWMILSHYNEWCSYKSRSFRNRTGRAWCVHENRT